MLALYRLLTFLVAPLAMWRLKRLGQTASPEARAMAISRQGQWPRSTPPREVDVWCHAASVGEVNTLAPLIEKALKEGHRVLITTFTPSGFDQALTHFGDRVQLAFAPLDTVSAVRRWLDVVNPPILLVAETELWPELFHQCHRRNIPVVLVNARLSTRHFRRYRRFFGLYQHALKAINTAACQSPAQKINWQQLGLSEAQTVVTGNLKAAGHLRAIRTQPALHQTPFCWVAGSVHPPEFAGVIEAHQTLIQSHPTAQLILAPRHLIHLDTLRQALTDSGLTWRPFSPGPDAPVAQTQVHLIETMGLLPTAYQHADVAFVGGSWVPVGGHNLYEPAAAGCAVLTGTHTNQQADAKRQLQAQGALMEVTDPADLTEALTTLAGQPSLTEQMRNAGHAVVEQQAKSLDETWTAIEPVLRQTLAQHRRSLHSIQ